MSQTPKVSVCVIAYNQEDYIEECLTSILRQKTHFPVEVIVRDDCSTDATARIVADIADGSSGRLRVLDGSHNLGANRNLLKTFSASRATYVALCEGDDYWLDPEKLAKQVHLLDAHECVDFVAHPCWISMNGRLTQQAFVRSTEAISFGTEDVLRAPGQFAPTASYMFRRPVLETLPEWFEDAPVGDFFLEMYALRKSVGLFMPDAMSVYRMDAQASWSSTTNERNVERWISFCRRMIVCLDKMGPDFVGCDLNPKLAACWGNLAIAALLLRNFSEFESAIMESARHKPRLSITHSALRRMRRLHWACYASYVAKRKVDRFLSRDARMPARA